MLRPFLSLASDWVAHWAIRTVQLTLPVAGTMKDDVALLATVTLVGVLIQGRLAPVWEVGGSYTQAACSLSFRPSLG